MRLLLLFFVLIIECSGQIQVSVDSSGEYRISIGGKEWLRSSYTAVYTDNRWFSSGDQSLPLVNITRKEGDDSHLGHWNETQLNYDLVRNGSHARIVASIRQWQQIPAFTFHLDTSDQTLTNTIPLHADQVRTVFPSFHIEETAPNDELAYFTFAGIMTGDGGKHAGAWNSSSKVVRSGMESGPIVLFNQTQKGDGDLVVLSPFSRFMATSLTQTNQTLEYGVMGSMLTITPNYNHSFIVFYSPHGINEGVREWGKAMQQAYNRTNQYRLDDRSINHLGYYTDNGAYYYYHTEEGKNYEQTMFDVLEQISLPFHYLQIDSWWYYKGIGEGVSEWVARPDIFPDGLPAFDRKIGNMSIVAHNRYWSSDTVYKNKYAFILDEKHGKALPVGNDSFWMDLFTQARQWGLIVYEQDWLITQTEDFTPLQTDLHLGHQWLMSMGEAAHQLDINLQYCMSLPRHILTALQIPRVTQTRTSTDYAFHLEGKADQWAIGISSMLADALGLAPFKDVLWSTSSQPGAPYQSNPKETNPDREIIIATMSTGPVAIGDGINYTNRDAVMQCCRQDGVILKPDRPLTTINRVISDWALYHSMPQGELYTTTTTIGDQIFHIIFASMMKQDYVIYPSMLGIDSGAIWDRTGASTISVFDQSNPLTIYADACPLLTVCLWYVSPIWKFDGEVSFMGELSKWTPVSRQRFTSIAIDTKENQARVTFQGVPDERVPIVTFYPPEGWAITSCFVGQNGTGWAIITSGILTCTENI